jgi:hypothetical protein
MRWPELPIDPLIRALGRDQELFVFGKFLKELLPTLVNFSLPTSWKSHLKFIMRDYYIVMKRVTVVLDDELYLRLLEYCGNRSKRELRRFSIGEAVRELLGTGLKYIEYASHGREQIAKGILEREEVRQSSHS